MAEMLPRPDELLAHRGMALVLDAITELEPGVHGTGVWTPKHGEFTHDTDYFDGHFPGEPILPGHWTMESVALIGGCVLLSARPNLLPFFRENHGIFKRPVRPGETLEVSAEFGELKEMNRGGVSMITASGTGQAKVDGKLVYEARILKAVAQPN